ncbi:TetR/AcrR family transcriptional regulator [Actinoplanes rectilineatus]|uniref:TetR/AcrR family transcriptional regulator n=1 Tax=Actinoplanes rectilineatus TaxID=113571 RepID=UPI0005F2F896|nr:helix-turn-helix domain-containing protein [Actinoplanes rectilineatus]
MTPENTQRPGVRETKRRQTRLALIGAALRLADTHGADRVTVDAISADAGVSPRTFFNYFATRDDALVGDPLEGCPNPGEELRAVPADRSVPDALLEVFTPGLARIEEDRDLWLLRMRVFEKNPQLLPLLAAAGMTAEQEMADAIGQRTGTGPDSAYPAVVAAAAGAALRVALCRWAAPDNTASFLDHFREAVGVLAAGLSHPPSEKAQS